MLELREIAKLFASAIACADDRDYSEVVEQSLAELRKLNHSAKIALRNAYIWSRKVPAPEREDMMQDLFLTLWEKNPENDKLAYSIARCDWQDWWKRYSVRSHYSLDWTVEDDNGENTTYGELLVGEIDFERRVDGEIDAEILWDKLPDKIQRIITKRLEGKGLTGKRKGKALTNSERVQLNRFVQRNYSLLADFS